MLISKLISAAAISAALIGLVILGFVAKEGSDVKVADTDRIQCEKQNITDLQVHECRVRLKWQTRHDQVSQLDIRR